MTIASAHVHDGSPGPRMLLSVAEVAAELGCGRDTVYRLMTSGALPSVIVGGRLRRVRREDLRAYVDSLAVTRPRPALPGMQMTRTAAGPDGPAGSPTVRQPDVIPVPRWESASGGSLRVPTPSERPTLTIAEVGRILQVSRTTAYRAASAGHLPTIQLSARRVVVPTAAFRAWLGLPGDPPAA